MSSKRPSLRRLAGYLWRHSFGRSKSSGDDHQMDADEPELQCNREEESALSEIPNLTISDPTGDSIANEKDLSHTPELVQSVYSEDVTIQLKATEKICELFLDPSNPLCEEIIKSGAVPRFIHFLEDSRYPELQYESACVLTNIALGTSAQTQVVIDAGAVPVLIKLISSPSQNVVEQSVWALGNIAGNSTEYRDLVLNSNVLPPLFKLFNDGYLSMSMRRTITFTLFDLCKVTNSLPNFEQVSQCLPLLTRLIFNWDDETLVNVCCALATLGFGFNEQFQVYIDSSVCLRAVELLSHLSIDVVEAASCLVSNITTSINLQAKDFINESALPAISRLLSHEEESILESACLALASLCDGSEEQNQVFIDFGVCPRAVQLLSHSSIEVVDAAIRLVSSIAAGNDSQVQVIINALPAISSLLSHEKESIVEDACLALANLCDGPEEQIQVVIESGVCPRAVQLLSHTSDEVVVEALGLVRNIASGNDSQTQVLINANALPVLRSLLSHEKESIVENACLVLTNISSIDHIQAVIDSNLIPPLIDRLHHPSISVCKSAAWAIANATAKGSEEQIVYIVKSGAIPALCKVLSEADSDLTENAAWGLENILRSGELCEKAADFTENPYAVLICNSPEMKLDSEDTAIQLEATKRFNKLLETSDGFNFIIDEVIKSGSVPRFVHFLEDSRFPELQFESASVLHSITGGNSAQTQVVIDAGAVPVLIKLISSSDEKVVEKSVLALGNIACDSTESRDLVLNSNVLPPLLGLFSNDNLSAPVLREFTWVLACLCDKSPQPNFEQVSPCLPLLARLMVNGDEEVLVNVCQALSHLCEGPNKLIQVVIESGVCPRAIQLLSHTSSEVVLEAICLVCNIAMGNYSQTQVLINENALPALSSLLFHEKESIVEDTCCTLASITAGNRQQIQAVIDANIVPSLIVLLHHGNFKIRKEAANVIANAATKGSVTQVVFIVEAGAIPSLCHLLSEADPDLIEEALSGLEKILWAGKEIPNSADSTEDRFATFIKQCGGFDKITLLSTHDNVKIAQKASILAEMYFP